MVRAAQTRSTGASKRRSMRTLRSESLAVVARGAGVDVSGTS